MIFYNNPDFYPTPAEIIDKMLTDDGPAGLTVLEPSAGSGNICEKLREYGAREILTCETDPNLQSVLRGKGFRLIASDFMQVRPEDVSHVDMIVMNPPFSDGARHIQHAYNIAPAGCVIIALCNTSNLESSYYTKYEKLAELVKMHGYSENLGEPFAEDAERRTRCRVSLVKLWKDGEGTHEFDGYFSAYEESDSTQGNQQEGLIQYNFLRDIVNRYVEAVKLFDGVMEATKKINAAATFVDYRVETDSNGEQKAIKQTYGALPISFHACVNRDRSNVTESEIDYLTYKRELQKYYWRIIFQKMNMEKYATRELREQINKFVEQRQNVPFTMTNIYKVLETVVKTNGQRMLRALCEAFDTICSLSAENSTAGETWKTNSNYMVNKRFISDWVTNIDYGGTMEVRDWSGSSVDKLNDVCKALCYMTGTEFSSIGNLGEHVRKHREEIEWGKWFEWGFFRCRGYKKGTMHFEFLDENVWARFNQEVAKTRGWKIGSTTNSEHGHKQNRRK